MTVRGGICWLAAALAVTQAGCAPAGSQTKLTVFAAASLTSAFEQLEESFEEAHSGAEVTVVFGGSAALATQIINGAPAEVFASASRTHMETVIAAGLAADATPFATNRMIIAMPKGNPGGIRTVADLARPGVTVAVCEPAVPCGAGAEAVFEQAGITVRPVTQEHHVKAALAKASLGEVDAAVVYATDVPASATDVHAVGIPAQLNSSTDYLITSTINGEHSETAQQFVQHVTSAQGRRVLTDAGFGPAVPPPRPDG